MCDQCQATPSLSHPITGWTLTRLTGAGQSSFCSLAVTVSHVAREHWLEVFWIFFISLCTMCDQCRATPSLSHPITGWTLTRLTGAGQSSFCSLAVTVSHVAREHWLEVFWILLIGSRYRSAHWDLWNRTIVIVGSMMAMDHFWGKANLFYAQWQSKLFFSLSICLCMCAWFLVSAL